jgi:hypothetical protein
LRTESMVARDSDSDILFMVFLTLPYELRWNTKAKKITLK